jgi:non-specific serine/threonine protein kinase
VRDETQVALAVATALELQEEQHRQVLDTLADHIRDKRLLVILDNCEHLLGACAGISEALLAHATAVRMLATSRQALGLIGEFIHRVPPLPVPESVASVSLEELRRVESVRLFAERAAAAAGSGFQLTEENATVVSRICRRLDGIPLAIELAAARVRTLPLTEIEKRLHDRFDLLSVGPSTSEPRHQTLRALIDWSHDLLSEREQRLFGRLGVFAGGWSLEAAEFVCADDGIEAREVLTLLSRLVEQSLVEVRAAGRRHGAPRYRMLEIVRAYARDHEDRGDFDDVRRRHVEYFGDLAEQAVRGLTGPEQAVWIAQLEENDANLRAAIDTAAESAIPLGLKMVGALGRYWYARGRWSEGRALMTEFLREPEAEPRNAERARALNWTGWLMYWQGDFEDANTVLMESLSISRELGDSLGIAEALNNLGAVETSRGHWDDARAHHEEALAIRRRAADRRAMAVSVHNLGETYLSQGEYEMARTALQESLTLFREVGYPMGADDSLSCLGQVAERMGDLNRATAYHEESLASRRERNEPVGTSESLRNLGRLAAQQGDYARAHALLTESLSIRRKLGDRMDIAAGLESLGALAARRGQATRAARILGAADALRERIHAPVWAGDRNEVERAVALVRDALSAEFDSEWSAGREMSDDAAIDLALAEN